MDTKISKLGKLYVIEIAKYDLDPIISLVGEYVLSEDFRIIINQILKYTSKYISSGIYENLSHTHIKILSQIYYL